MCKPQPETVKTLIIIIIISLQKKSEKACLIWMDVLVRAIITVSSNFYMETLNDDQFQQVRATNWETSYLLFPTYTKYFRIFIKL